MNNVDWLGLALDLEQQAKRVKSQTAERAMIAAANGLRLMGQQAAQEPIGYLYDWTHSSALGKPDEHFTSFTTDKARAERDRNPRPVYAAAPSAGRAAPEGGK